ncbi:MAG: hypothetical protein CMB99_12250 [Flavobacteriaceae bacterium]|nr:hypothetical protein [Flavobacteriaceae bacterium]|tara:strand:+ start:105019 stop:105411 length:393 start_codon:yes stop_codon:yes gene_type:complete
MKKSKIVLFSFFAGLIATFLILRYVYKDHRDIATESASFRLVSSELITEFSTDAEAATTKYLDQTVEISGEVSGVSEAYFTLNQSIVCYTDSLSISKISNSQQIKAKGRFIGYDDLLEEIKFDQVTIIHE